MRDSGLNKWMPHSSKNTMANPFSSSPYHFFRSLSIAASALAICMAASPSTSAGAETTINLYHTDFSSFPLGDGKLVGQDGWMSSHPDERVHGTVDDFFTQGDRSGTLGLFIPETKDKIISAYRPLNYDPIASNTPIIEFSANIAIVDSFDTEFYDSFYLSVFNSNTNLLAAVVFDNTPDDFGIWRADGDGFFDTGVSFEHNKLYKLRIRIDFAENTWTATVDNTPLFAATPFSNSGAKLDLGDISVEWEISDINNPGDNWILFDDWSVNAVTTVDTMKSPLVVSQIQRLPNGAISMLWTAEPNTRYQIETSPDFSNWDTSLANSLITTGANERNGSFVDPSAASSELRYYRVRQLP